ncbi:MAG: TetR/AcrR family transcriptional regulator, partial [Pseudomonadota bacterium]
SSDLAAAHHVDLARDVDARLAASRAAETGEARLDAYIEAWGGYIPEVHAVAAALRAAQDGDDAARAAWSDRMEAMRHGCAAAVAALARDGDLTPALDEAAATDLLFALLSIEVWEHLARDRAWPQDRYIAEMKRTARAALMR